MSHPMAKIDGVILDLLERVEIPVEGEVVEAARLLARYPAGSERLRLEGIAARWGMDIAGLCSCARSIWASGWKPSVNADVDVGSGADVTS